MILLHYPQLNRINCSSAKTSHNPLVCWEFKLKDSTEPRPPVHDYMKKQMHKSDIINWSTVPEYRGREINQKPEDQIKKIKLWNIPLSESELFFI